MQVSDLDGFLTGLVVGPEMIMPNEWLPIIWGNDGPKFRDAKEAQRVIGIIMARYNEIVRDLHDPKQFGPIFWETKSGDAIAMDWAEGFFDAVRLRPKTWATLLGNQRGKSMMAPLIALWTDDAKKQFSVKGSDITCEVEEAADRIVDAVVDVYEYWKTKR